MDSWVPLVIGFVVVWLITIGVCRTRPVKYVYPELGPLTVYTSHLDFQELYAEGSISDYDMVMVPYVERAFGQLRNQVLWQLGEEAKKWAELEVYKDDKAMAHVVRGRLYVARRPETSAVR